MFQGSRVLFDGSMPFSVPALVTQVFVVEARDFMWSSHRPRSCKLFISQECTYLFCLPVAHCLMDHRILYQTGELSIDIFVGLIDWRLSLGNDKVV